MAPPVDRPIHRPLPVRVKPTTDRIQRRTSGRCPDVEESMSPNAPNRRHQQSQREPRVVEQTLHVADDGQHSLIWCQEQSSK